MPTLFVTAPPDAAGDLATGLVEAELAACVNRLECHSTYRWEGEIHDEREEILLVKTTDGAVEDCREWLVAEHPYDVPCVELYEAEDALPAYREWQADVVAE